MFGTLTNWWKERKAKEYDKEFKSGYNYAKAHLHHDDSHDQQEVNINRLEDESATGKMFGNYGPFDEGMAFAIAEFVEEQQR